MVQEVEKSDGGQYECSTGDESVLLRFSGNVNVIDTLPSVHGPILLVEENGSYRELHSDYINQAVKVFKGSKVRIDCSSSTNISDFNDLQMRMEK